MTTTFRSFRQFNDPKLHPVARITKRLDARALPYLTRKPESPTLMDRVVTAIAKRQVLPIKELLESFELFERVRRRMRAATVVDLCCGHGLTGLLFVVFSRPVQHVILVDRRQPASYQKVLAAVTEAAPWIEGRVEYIEASLEKAKKQLPRQDVSFVAVHACGARTDRCLEIAMERNARVAVMPCCYFGTADRAPSAIRKALGSELATDIERTYRLRQAGYRVEWSAIPEAITPKNRILIGIEPHTEAEPQP